MAAKAAAECAHATRDESVYEPWEMTPREKEVATKYIKLIQGTSLQYCRRMLFTLLYIQGV